MDYHHSLAVAYYSFWLTFWGWEWPECWKHWATECGIGTINGIPAIPGV